MKVSDWVRTAESRLESAGVDAPKLEAQLLAAHVLRVDRVWIFTHPEAEFSELAGESLISRRIQGEPLAYILGYREFYGRNYSVDSSVLVPRHETEVLVETVLKRFPISSNVKDRLGLDVLDMGVGSGIVAVTLKLERPWWNLVGVDISPEALTSASANAIYHDADIRMVLSDIFSGLLGESFDVIVSNPPYIGIDEPLPKDVAEHEPKLALFAERGGLAFYERLAAEAQDFINDGGVLLVEVGYLQAPAVLEIFGAQGWRLEEEAHDLSGILRVLGFSYSFECAV